MSELNLKHCL